MTGRLDRRLETPQQMPHRARGGWLPAVAALALIVSHLVAVSYAASRSLLPAAAAVLAVALGHRRLVRLHREWRRRGPPH